MERVDVRLMGFLYADGWCYYNKNGEYYEVCFQQVSRNVYEYYRSKVLADYKGYYRERMRKGKYEICIYSLEWYRLVESLKSNPIKYLQINPQEFITGFFDGDGSNMGDEIAMYDKNKELLDAVCSYLENLGIRCVVRPCKSIWRIRIRDKQSCNKFIENFPVLLKK